MTCVPWFVLFCVAACSSGGSGDDDDVVHARHEWQRFARDGSGGAIAAGNHGGAGSGGSALASGSGGSGGMGSGGAAGMHRRCTARLRPPTRLLQRHLREIDRAVRAPAREHPVRDRPHRHDGVQSAADHRLGTTARRRPTRADANMPSKWEITSDALIEAMKTLPPTASVGISYFSNDEGCGVNSMPSVPLALNKAAQQAAMEASLNNVTPGGGTPLVGATILAYKHLHELALAGSITGNEFVVLITDGEQSEQCSYAPRCTDAQSCYDLLVDTRGAEGRGPGVGIRTFVIGAPGSEAARTVLSQIAKNGGTGAPGCDPAQGNCHFDMTKGKDFGAGARQGAVGDRRPDHRLRAAGAGQRRRRHARSRSRQRRLLAERRSRPSSSCRTCARRATPAPTAGSTRTT